MRRLTWIVWMVVALLPMRGWAFAAMPTVPGTGGPVAVFAPAAHPEAHEAAADSMPCHGVEATESRHGGTADADGTCALCQICHAAFAAAPSVPACEPPLAQRAAPPSHDAPAPDAERRSLFRPPRT